LVSASEWANEVMTSAAGRTASDEYTVIAQPELRLDSK
jgi:hypothetical protein